MSRVCMLIIGFYRRYISPMTGAHCRFYPTCSEYSYEAFKKYGFFKGLSLSFKRIIKCHPLNKGGYDPLP